MTTTSRDTFVKRRGPVYAFKQLLSARFVLPLLTVVAAVLYLPGLTGWAVADDIEHLRGAVVGTRPFRTFFRPLEQAVNVLNVRWFGLTDLRFAHAVGLAGLLTTLTCVYALGRRLGGALPAAFAAGLVAVSPLATASVIQIDTLSQQFVTVFALLFLLTLLPARARSSAPLYGLAYSFALLALLSKEAAPGLVAAVPLAAFLLRPPEPRTLRRVFYRLLTEYAGVFLVVALYTALRLAAGVGFGEHIGSGQYDLELSPARITRNIALYGGSLFYTGGSTLDLFPTPTLWRMLVSGVLTGGLLAASLVGAARLTRERGFGRPLLGLSLLTLAGTFPVVLTEQVSELYTYGSLPFYALLLGFSFPAGVGALARRFRARWLRPAATGFATLLLVWSAWGAAEKVRLINGLGERSQNAFERTQAFLEEVPEGPLRLCWQDAPSPVETYSTLVMRPELVAGRAMGLAAWLEGRALYLAAPELPFKNVGVTAGAWLLPRASLPAASSPGTLTRAAAGGCTHSVALGADGLRFTQP